ncbi:DnaD domain protein [Clostridium botulinum]|uniref:DnaD domain protein n=1 Tax=Clostridium botulinum TaxID=1491 RepID=UPI000207500A|nr:DnaD domain protein [Clostridium botulinum]AEB77662.1 putative replication initiation and membrane attachment [Clostridium botulinum BKT015925]KLU74221.1 putative replication initiation and membrane attachment protein [Clostridium botulinum V891]
MAVIRVIKDKQNPYMMINKSFIYDARLSLKSKGLMSYFLSRPDNWEFYQTEIKKHTTDRDRAISSAIQELITCGYIKRNSKRGEHGKFKGGYDYEVYETPIDVDSPKLQNAEPAKCQNGEMPNRQNDVLLNNESLLNNDFKVINEFNNKKKEIENPLIVYENNIFPTPGVIDIESINSWTDKLGADIVVYAINIAAKANARRLNYIEKILIDWERQGITTLEQAQAYTANRSNKKKQVTLI